jgi:hypothetical protein
LKTSPTERQLSSSAERSAESRPTRRRPDAPISEDATDRALRAERIVYLFPEGFDTKKFLEGQLNGEHLFEYTRTVPPERGSRAAPFTFFGHFRDEDFAIEVRPRSATIAAPSFGARRDLLLAVKEFVDLTSPRRRI